MTPKTAPPPEPLEAWAVVFTGADGVRHVLALASQREKLNDLKDANEQWSHARLVEDSALAQEVEKREAAERERDEARSERDALRKSVENLAASHQHPRLEDVVEIEKLKAQLAERFTETRRWPLRTRGRR